MIPPQGGNRLTDRIDTDPPAPGSGSPGVVGRLAALLGVGGPPSPLARALVLVLLAMATFAVFAGVLHSDWLQFDDPTYVWQNEHVNHGVTLDGIVWFLNHNHSANWHPLTTLSHMIDVQLFGLKPAGHHAVNLLFHILNALLLVMVLHRMTGAWWRSVLVGALFALHPLRVESVAWISERKDVLSGFFFLLVLAAYARWTARPGRARYAAVMALYALGLLAKPMLLTLPFVLLLLDVWPLRRAALPGGGPRGGRGAPAASPGDHDPAAAPRRRPLSGLIAEKWPLFALTVASAILTYIFQRQGGAVVSDTLISPDRRVCNALISWWRYVGQMFWPVRLAPYYPYSGGAPYLRAAVAALALVAMTILLLRRIRKRPYLPVGWLWYVGMMVPVIGLVQVGGQAHADRYTYLPGIGLAVALVWWVGDLVSGSRRARAVAAAVSVIVLAVLAVTTARQVARWKDTRTLFAYTLTVTRDNMAAHQILGTADLQAGDAAKALPNLEAAVRLAPYVAEAHNNLGSALAVLGRHDEAIAQFETVFRLTSESASAHNNMGISLAAQGRYEEAIAHFRTALLKMSTADIHENLAYALTKVNRTDEAIPEFEAALRMDPTHYLSLVRLGVALGNVNRLSESEARLRQALKLKPADAEARRLLASTLVREERVEEAVQEYRKVLETSPDDLDALNNVAWIRATHARPALRDGAEAVRLAEHARDKSPEPSAVLYSTLAAAYAEADRFPEAVRAGRRAVQLAGVAGDQDAVERYTRQLELYLKGKPFHFEP